MNLKELLGDLYTEEIEAKLKDKVVLKSEQDNMIPKTRFDQVNKDKKEYKEKLEEAMSKLEGFGDSEATIEELKGKLATMKGEHEAFIVGIEKEKVNSKKKDALKSHLKTMNVLNPELLLQFYDLETLSFDGDSLMGHVAKTEQLKEKYKDQFGVETTKSPDITMKFKNKLFKDMTPSEKIVFKQEDPSAYEKARGAYKLNRR